MREILADEFKDEVVNKKGVVVVEFFGVWCMPCKMIGGIIKKVEENFEGKVNIFQVDVDKNTELAKTYGVLTVPTIIVFKDGEEVDKSVGFRQEKQITEMINKFL